MVKVRMGARELVEGFSLLTVLPLVILPVDTPVSDVKNTKFGTKVGNPVIIAAVVKVLSALWSTAVASAVRRKDDTTIATEQVEMPLESKLDTPEEEKRRKRNHHTESQRSKKVKRDTIDYESDAHESDFDETVEEELKEDVAARGTEETRVLPTAFVQEFLNCVTLLTPTIISRASEATAAQHCSLLTDSVQYITALSMLQRDRTKFHLVALAPEAVKQQVS